MEVGVEIHSGTLDGLAQQKLLVDNLRIPTCELGNDVKWFKETQTPYLANITPNRKVINKHLEEVVIFDRILELLDLLKTKVRG